MARGALREAARGRGEIAPHWGFAGFVAVREPRDASGYARAAPWAVELRPYRATRAPRAGERAIARNDIRSGHGSRGTP